MTVDDVIADVRDKMRGRTYFEGSPRHPDEILVAEIERLRDDLSASERLRRHAERELGKDSAIVERLRAALTGIVKHMDANGMQDWAVTKKARRALSGDEQTMSKETT